MLAFTIVCFSLLAAAWMSGVSAVLDGPKIQIVNTFLQRLMDGESLAAAYYHTQHIEEALDDYCRHMIDLLAAHVNDYLTRIDPNMHYDTHQPPARGGVFDRAWKEIPYILYWIRYSNLLILNVLKQDLIRRGHRISPRSILAVIDEAYVSDVSEKHGVNNHPPEDLASFQKHIINIAKQFSMNKAMIARYGFQTPLRARLQFNQNMIIDLHDHMVRYMRIETRFDKHYYFTALENEINVIYMNQEIRGYEHDLVKLYVGIVSREMLAVIAIYAAPPLPVILLPPLQKGTEVISGLSESQWVVRHFMSLDGHPYVQLGLISDELLNALGREIQNIRNIYLLYKPGHEWMSKLLPILNALRGVGRRNN
jgi:hypothetical protein